MTLDRYRIVRDLLQFHGHVTAAMLARQLRISRQAARKYLEKATKRGQLHRIGLQRARRYEAPIPSTLKRYEYSTFWKALLSERHRLAYVELARIGVKPRLRSQVKVALANATWDHCDFVFVDFLGIDDTTEDFLDELLRVWPSGLYGVNVLPINMSPVIREKIARINLRADGHIVTLED